MKKKRIGIVALCLLIGFGIVVQAKVTDGQRLYVSQKTIEDYKTMIQGEKTALDDISKLEEEAKENLKLYNKDSGEEIRQVLEQDLEKHRIASGAETVKGQGVIITVDDGTRALKKDENINDLIVHESDILKIINELNAAGAEAISVNGQRFVATTSITCGGYTVRINGRTYGRPFIIKAIGDNTKLTDRLIGVGGYGKKLQNWGLRFEVQSGDSIVIPAYNGKSEPQYMKEQKGE